MTFYTILAVVHVIAAVGGLGQISVLAVMTRKPELGSTQLMRQIFKAVGGSLGVMLVTGLGMMWLSAWVYEPTWWFRISFLLFIGLGALHGIGQSTLKKIIASGTPLAGSPLLGKLRTLTVWMSVVLALIVLLMEGKPF